MEDLPALVVEFFGSGRLEILRELSSRTMRFTELSRRVEASNGELSRNLRRLLNAGLLDKNHVGSYALTPVAQALFAFLPGLETIGRYRAYFNSHELSWVPPDLLLRLNDLTGARFLEDPLESSTFVQGLIQGTRRLHYSMCAIGRHSSKLEWYALQLRALMQERPDVKYVAGRNEMERYARMVTQIEPQALGLVQVRTVDAPPGVVMVTDAGAAFALPDRAGSIDLNYIFCGTDERFVRWCRDFFEAQWLRATPVDLRSIRRTMAMPARV